jgi:hypothetical protein
MIARPPALCGRRHPFCGHKIEEGEVAGEGGVSYRAFLSDCGVSDTLRGRRLQRVGGLGDRPPQILRGERRFGNFYLGAQAIVGDVNHIGRGQQMKTAFYIIIAL